MDSSLKIARIWGIDIQVHWSFVLILFYGAFLFSRNASNVLAGAIYGVIVILLLFVCVVLHEFGHAITAKYFGIKCAAHHTVTYRRGGPVGAHAPQTNA